MLKLLQEKLPKIWTDELYSAEFRARVSSYKDFDHALKHITKAVGKLIDVTEAADHDGKVIFDKDVEKYLADLVICTVRLALTNPNGQIDLEKAILDRIETKMNVKLTLQNSQTMLETLKWLDRRGGLGLDVHERIRVAIDSAQVEK